MVKKPRVAAVANCCGYSANNKARHDMNPGRLITIEPAKMGFQIEVTVKKGT
jgi:hypothetical protein